MKKLKRKMTLRPAARGKVGVVEDKKKSAPSVVDFAVLGTVSLNLGNIPATVGSHVHFACSARSHLFPTHLLHALRSVLSPISLPIICSNGLLGTSDFAGTPEFRLGLF